MLQYLFGMTGALADEAAGAAEAAATETAAQVNSVVSLLFTFAPLLLIFVVFWFMMIRPQRKKDKAVKDMLAALKPGDRICTIGGIYGTIASIKDETITLYVGSQKMQMVVARWAIRSVEDAPLVENESEALV